MHDSAMQMTDVRGSNQQRRVVTLSTNAALLPAWRILSSLSRHGGAMLHRGTRTHVHMDSGGVMWGWTPPFLSLSLDYVHTGTRWGKGEVSSTKSRYVHMSWEHDLAHQRHVDSLRQRHNGFVSVRDTLRGRPLYCERAPRPPRRERSRLDSCASGATVSTDVAAVLQREPTKPLPHVFYVWIRARLLPLHDISTHSAHDNG
ncbi:hypothetical protein BD289DRAFT_504019 [Coniella lustricola]|uniref:Uncharacterized protein n=1 Tax=Coniella lustricola TaxID=2025994 RepID=A0A2T3AFP7_9PEZI|nr:hypothetical protein BD289DRAFT_504019 [Coniella lustricola]